MTIKFSKDHEWINAADANASVVGITVHAQDALGDVVFVDLPEVGKSFAQGEVAGVVESVKAAADVYIPADSEGMAPGHARPAALSRARSFPGTAPNPLRPTRLPHADAIRHPPWRA